MLKEWKELNSVDFRGIQKEDAAILVIGSCEQHGLHLPMGTDVFLGEEVIRRAAKCAKRRIFLLPSISYGFSAHHMDFPGSITLSQETLCHMIIEVVSCVIKAGFGKVILVVSHGGNSPSVHMAVNELGIRCTGSNIIMLRYWDFMREFMEELRDSPMGGIGHAGEMETSMMMAALPHLVKEGWENYTLTQGNEWYHPDMFAANRITVYKRFRDISEWGNVGVCDCASAEKGERIFEYLGAEIGRFLDEYD